MLAVLLAFVLGQIVGPLHIEEEEDGPQIIFASTRDQVFYCDFSSPVCSDGRVITTTRSTPVPCETSPGVWEMVPENTGCYSVRGLESWAQNTSYLSYGADLTNTAWLKHGGMSVEKVGSIYRIRRNKDNTAAAFVYQETAPVTQQETWTAACVMRAGTATVARLSVDRGAGSGIVNLTSEWQVFTSTRTFAVGRVPGVSIGPEFTAGDSYIEVAGCWLTKSDTPGRPCWGGEAPVTCAADQHTISTEGWPTEEGEVSATFTIQRTPGLFQHILNSRRGGSGNDEFVLEIRDLGSVTLRGWGGQQNSVETVSWESGRPYRVHVAWGPWGRRVKLDGVTIMESSEPTVMGAGEVMRLGHSSTLTQHLNGTISSLRIRSTP